jgi:mono/diheme cytochrome c family protein
MSEGTSMRIWLRPLAACVVVLAAGCRQEMYDQPRYEPQEASRFFADGTSDRPLLPGVVPRLEPGDSAHDLLATYMVDGKLVDTLPFEFNRDVLDRGRERYQIFCTPCHGAKGDGRGMIVLRGFSPPPAFYGKRPIPAEKSPAASFYADLRDAPLGHFFDVITNGHGAMYSYAARIQPVDRWKIAAYIKALQLSQYAKVDDLPDDVRKELPRSSQ